MKHRLLLASAVAMLVAVGGGACAEGNDDGRPRPDPGRDRAQLVPAAPGVEIRPILSAGDIVGAYQMSGVPDGLGAYVDGAPSSRRGGGEGLKVLMNHELEGEEPNDVGARVSQLDLDRDTRRVRAARYPVDTRRQRGLSAVLLGDARDHRRSATLLHG